MSTQLESGLGKVHIADEVIAIVAGVAATECYGLVGMAGRTLQDGIAELLGQENLDRGVVVRFEDDLVEIDLYIIVEYGTRISEVAHNVMQKVKYTVETMLGIQVSRVNVHVQGVRVAELGRPTLK